MKKTFELLTKDLEKYTNHACNSFAKYFSHITFDDLKQECLIRIYDVEKRNRNLSYAEIKELCKTSMYNRLKDLYRYEIRRIKVHISEEPDDGESFTTIIIDSSSSAIDEICAEDAILSIRNSLGKNERQIFDLLLQPDESLVRLSEAQYRSANERKLEGQLAMGVNTVKITSKNLAQRLNVSPATVSRCLERIHYATLEALNE